MNKQVLIGLSTLSLVTILSAIALLSSNSFAASASTATAAVKVAASCTLTSTGGGNYSATVPNGTSAEIEGSTLTASCNDAGGFALYAVGYSNDTIGNNNMIGSSTNIPTNTSGTNSYWAMKINPTSGNTPTIENSFNNYHIVPDIHTKVASHSSSTGTGSLSVNATYKANISSTQLAGNYLGKVKYTLLHPANEVLPHEIMCEAGKVCYNPNTVTIEGQMGKQTASSNATIELWAPNFKRDGYGFAGWSDKYDYETNPDAHFYGPNQTIITPADTSANGLSLYAVWIPSAGTMQTWNNCSNLTQAPAPGDGVATLSSVTALTDERDGNTYAVAKLADGKCWTIENLRLNDVPELSPTNTHNPSLPINNSWYYADQRTTLTTSNHLSPTTNPYNTRWCYNYNLSSCLDQSMVAINNTIFFTNNTASNYNIESDVYSYGNYYNWYSATAGHGKYGNDYSSGYTSPGDICPAGWRLTTGGGSSKDLIVLDIATGGSGGYQEGAGTAQSRAWRSYPNNFVYSGGAGGPSISSRGVSGDYWTASASSNSNAWYLSFSADFLNPNEDDNKYVGNPVRCIANS